jgi:hypothetical protein
LCGGMKYQRTNHKQKIWVVERGIREEGFVYRMKIDWEPDDICLTRQGARNSKKSLEGSNFTSHGWIYRVRKYMPRQEKTDA